MMNPKLKIFLSSAQFNDEFSVEREGLPVIFEKQPLVAGFFLWRIEDYCSPEKIDNHYIKHVADADIVILLLGKSYRDAVKKEFEEAKKRAVPVFAFIRNESDRDADLETLISLVRVSATTVNYSNFTDLVSKIESSLFQHFLKSANKPSVVQWKEERARRTLDVSKEESSLRLLAGVLASDATPDTQSKVARSVLFEAAISINESKRQNDLLDFSMQMLRSSNTATKKILKAELDALLAKKELYLSDDQLVKVATKIHEDLISSQIHLADADNTLFVKLYNLHKEALKSVELAEFRAVVAETVTQVVYDTAIDMVEQEFGTSSSSFNYNADELNRIVMAELLRIKKLSGDPSAWQAAIVGILQSNDTSVVRWLNRQRKAYWTLAVLGMNPQAIEYAAEHLKGYCIYFDSHVVLRAIVDAGGESGMCNDILRLGQKLHVNMRLSDSLFQEVDQAIQGANRTYIAAEKDIVRAITAVKAVNRRSDVLDGFLAALEKNHRLSWDNYLNRFYSPADPAKLKRYIENELGVSINPSDDFTVEQLGRIEDLTQMLLEQRRQMVHPPKNLSGDDHHAWERQHILRTNEARQMAIVYDARRNKTDAHEQFWFVTFDQFVYEVSSALVAKGDADYGFPCYMKPATWLGILSNAAPETVPINTYREVLLSRDIQRVADQVETEVISQLLKSRVDQDVKNIETLRSMFADIVNRSAVQDAYQSALAAEGVQKIVAMDKVKDRIIEGMKTSLNDLKNELDLKKENISAAEIKARKAEKRAHYFKQQLGTILHGRKKK